MNIVKRHIADHFSAELTNSLFDAGTKKLIGANEHLFFEGEDATFLPIVLSGKIKMVRYPEPGKEIIIGVFRSGEIFAIPPAMDGKRFPATAVAIVESQVLLIPRSDFLDLMRTSAEFSSMVTGQMCGILRERAQTVQILATSSAEQRIANVLLRLVGDMNGDVVKKIPHRRQDIAEMSGLSLETTIRVVRKLAAKGCFQIVRGRIILESTEPLQRLLR
ncbi:MAG: Crp/Fnr family transcriptional regulator [Pyrinomonadaceae bacterium]|nr:Crp/Fnr family transcriptional regulator [Pyrinomonadaceae bacterium]MBP6211537.1 Crp/Fnr family transcriptional regulator [Pyrinomonadaceae bacterium]